MMRKILIVGASLVGIETVERILEWTDAGVVLLDGDAAAAESAVNDLSGARPAGRAVTATGSWEAAAGADGVVLAGGDVEAARAAAAQVAEHSPGAVVVVATDPVEESCAAVLEATRFPRARVVGVGGAVEALRLRAGLARALAVSARDVSGLVLGGRGARAVPLLGTVRVAGVAATDKLPAERVGALVAALSSGPPAGPRTVAAATAEVVRSAAGDRRRLIPCAMLCQGELGIQDAIAGVPVVVGAGGVEQVLDVPLDGDEREALAAAAVGYAGY